MSGLAIPTLDAPGLRRYGLPELVYAASPAAGTDFSAALGGDFYTRLVTVYATLTTDGTAGDRELTLEYRNAEGAVFCRAGAPVEVTATTVTPYMFSAFLDAAVWPVDSSVLVPLAPILLGPTQSFRLHIVGVQAGDTITTVRYVQERFYSDVPLA